MAQQYTIRDAARNLAAADLFRKISTEEKAAKFAEELQNMPDAMLQTMARMSGIPAHQTALHLAMMRGQENEFSRGLNALDGWFQTGDLILMTGNLALAQAQKALYKDARSSHVAIVHADFICIDAIPKVGASNRVIPDVLADVEPGWRVIRHTSVGPENTDHIMRACSFYLAQPYKILPSKKSAKKFAYCSELARKVYRDIGVAGTGIPDDRIIAPAHFDRLADHHPNWVDVTDSLRPAVEFCQKYPEILRATAKMFIDGLKLNRRRFEERTELLAKIRDLTKAGKISKEDAQDAVAQIREIEHNMNHTFWDVPRKAGGFNGPGEDKTA
ncbi:hypothetical protein [Cupriavidus basilensis]|uniref:hypothetical protein n=1 Tax=Cupriavidus basilensis TaxID=68895 RepID=UPI000750E169|nr:hypothetical protein [Cupriavidus basilensis]